MDKTDGYQRHREGARRRQADQARAGQDIGAIPAPVNLQRKAEACASLLEFKRTYFPHRYTLSFSADHLEANARTEDALNNGGLYALAMPRGSGKTTDAEVACLYAALTGKHLFTLLMGSSREHALGMLAAIKEELEGNPLLAEDFPEVCFPIECLEDRANRCKGQHTCGAKTKMVWSTDRITLPTIAGSRASGATIRVAGITGSFRGAKRNSLRPSLCILDDCQTDASAASLSQCEKRHRIINGAVLGLAGPGQRMTAIMLCTVIRQGDLADTMLDREKSPLWTGQRFKLLYSFPTNMSLWDQYATLRADEFRNGGDGSAATAFYRDNREAMDAGAVVAWPERYKQDELSAIQHALNLFYADRWSFWAEYQNSPLTEDLGEGQLEKDKVGARICGLARGVAPLRCSHITAFIDVQQKVLFWLVAGWSDDFTGSIIDYGSWPDQGRRYYTAADVQRTIARATPGAGLEAQIHAALGHCAGELLGRSFAREDGAQLKIEKLLIDAGYEGDTVKAWCRTTHHAALVMPSHGHGVSASAKPWEEYDRSRCEKLGTHWLIPKILKKGTRHVLIDTNHWKSFLRGRLQQAVGDRGALTIFGKSGQDHRMLADHLTAEYWIETEGRGRKVHEWKMRPGMTENHWWDCLVGCAVGGSMLGCSILEGGGRPPTKKVKYSDLYKQARAKAG
jgi:hypothetical protein